MTTDSLSSQQRSGQLYQGTAIRVEPRLEEPRDRVWTLEKSTEIQLSAFGLFIGLLALLGPLVLLEPARFGATPAQFQATWEALQVGQAPSPLDLLPGGRIPYYLAWLLGGHLSTQAHFAMFGLVMVAALGAACLLVEEVGRSINAPDAGIWWVFMAGPLFPLVLFRDDPWSVVLTVAALASVVAGLRWRSALLEILAVSTKGWPLVLAVAGWQRGNRLRTLSVVAAVVAAVVLGDGRGLLSLGGAVSAESVGGSLLVLWRGLSGGALGLINAGGSAYIGDPGWAQFLGIGLGLAIAVAGLARWHRSDSWTSRISLLGALTVGLLIANPWLGSSSILWLSVFLALHRSRAVRIGAVVTSCLSLVLAMGWGSALEGTRWWFPVLGARTLALLWLGGLVIQINGYSRRSAVATMGIPRHLIKRTLGALGGLIIVSWAFLAFVHVGDLYRMDHASRVRIALAKYAQEGVIFPAPFDGVRFAGTRWMPLPFVLHSWFARITGEFLVSGKLLTYLSVIALITLVALVLRRLRCPWSVVAALIGTLLVSWAGLHTTLGVRWDALAVLMQVGALGLIAAAVPPRRRSSLDAVAVFLCVLAVLTKITAVWGPIAILLWLAMRNRRRALRFAIFFGGGSLLALGGLQWLTEGRMLNNFVLLAGAGFDGPMRSAVRAPYRFLELNVRNNPTAWLLLPLPLLLTVRRIVERGPSLYQLAFLIALLGTMVQMADSGVAENHFLDFMTPMALVIGEWWARVSPRARWTGAGYSVNPRTVLASILVGVLLITYPPTMGSDVFSAAARNQLGDLHPYEFEQYLSPEDQVFSDDPFVEVSKGDPPQVVDSWTLAHLVRSRPGWADGLIDRFRSREFDQVLLMNPIDLPGPYYREYLGRRVAEAIRSSYAFCRATDQHYIYVPSNGVMPDYCSA